MSGRPSIKVHMYNGKGGYIQSFESLAHFRKKHFPNDIGKRPILIYKELGIDYYYNKEFDYIIMSVRPGREKIKHIVAIHTSEYCKKQDDDDQKPIQLLNLRGDVIAEFKSQRLLYKLVSAISQENATRSLKRTAKRSNINSSKLFVQYKTIPKMEEIVKKGKTFVIGDIHGNYKGLLQCLERSGFENDVDTLISLGDVVDGHCESFEVVEELLKIKNLITIKGNHDDWFLQWLETGINPANWGQGQKATGLSYLSHSRPTQTWTVANKDLTGFEVAIKSNDIPDSHIKFFKNQLPYYKDEQNNLFIHGGFNRHFFLDDQDKSMFCWDRDLWSQALSFGNMSSLQTGTNKEFIPKFKILEKTKEIFIGHTSTQFWKVDEPMHAANIWNLDTGGGWFGKISIMDIDTKEFWQSDKATELYPEFKGR